MIHTGESLSTEVVRSPGLTPPMRQNILNKLLYIILTIYICQKFSWFTKKLQVSILISPTLKELETLTPILKHYSDMTIFQLSSIIPSMFLLSGNLH